MKNKQSYNRQQWLAISILLGLILIMTGFVATFLHQKSVENEKIIDSKLFQIKKLHQIIEKQKSKSEQQINLQDYFYQHKNTGTAIEKLKEDIVAITKLKADKESEFKLEADSDSWGVKVKVNGMFTAAQIHDIKRILYELEHAKPLLIVEELNIRLIGNPNREKKHLRFNIHLMIQGFVQKIAE